MGDAPRNAIRHTACEALIEALRGRPVENALVLLKGSRGIGLERLIEFL